MVTDSARVTETIAFINNHATSLPVRRQAAAQFCRQTYPKLSVFDFGAYNTEFHALSSAMSVKHHATVPAGNQDERATRRAIYLIWKSINKIAGPHPNIAARADAAMGMATGNLDAALVDAILKASVYHSPAAAADVFNNEVVAHPRRFLTAHKVIVLGLTRGGDKFTNPASPSFANVINFSFQYDPTNDRFVFAGNGNPNMAAHVFPTVSVPAVIWYDVPGNGGELAPSPRPLADFAQILGCELTGANFMLTTQFTGCAFCWTNHGGVMRAAHVAPAKPNYVDVNLPTSHPGGGNGLASRIVAQGNAAGMANAGGPANAGGAAVTVFGRGAGNAPVAAGNPFYPNANLTYATIIGCNTAGWRFYMQAVDTGGNISEARRIY